MVAPRDNTTEKEVVDPRLTRDLPPCPPSVTDGELGRRTGGKTEYDRFRCPELLN